MSPVLQNGRTYDGDVRRRSKVEFSLPFVERLWCFMIVLFLILGFGFALGFLLGVLIGGCDWLRCW